MHITEYSTTMKQNNEDFHELMWVISEYLLKPKGHLSMQEWHKWEWDRKDTESWEKGMTFFQAELFV